MGHLVICKPQLVIEIFSNILSHLPLITAVAWHYLLRTGLLKLPSSLYQLFVFHSNQSLCSTSGHLTSSILYDEPNFFFLPFRPACSPWRPHTDAFSRFKSIEMVIIPGNSLQIYLPFTTAPQLKTPGASYQWQLLTMSPVTGPQLQVLEDS